MAELVQQIKEPPPLQGRETPMERGERLLPRRRFFSDMPDKGLFALAAVLGFSGILLFKLKGVDPDYVAGAAVGIMLIYGIAAFQFRRIKLRPDRLGDNFYYLGFIYTLASLCAALLQFKTGVQIDDLLGSFGIALLTTVVGIAGRVLFVQMRGDLDEIEDEVRKDLLHTSSDLRAQLNITLAEFETFQLGVRQATNEAAKQSSTAAQDAISNISSVAGSAAENIKQAFSREADEIRSFEQTLANIDRGIKNLASDINDRLDEFANRVDRMVTELSAVIDIIGRIKQKRRFWLFRGK